MPKKLIFESAVHHFAAAAKRYLDENQDGDLASFVDKLQFSYPGKRRLLVSWGSQETEKYEIQFKEIDLYQRGDSLQFREKQISKGWQFVAKDSNSSQVAHFFDSEFREVARRGGITGVWGESGKLHRESSFHDDWAESEDPGSIDVRLANESPTAPEMRFIIERLGNIKGKKLLDIGCGLGEASVYFAQKGALVTASDLSPGMLKAASKLAEINRVSLQTALLSAENLNAIQDHSYDLIYMGNVWHHTDISKVLPQIHGLLAPGGLMVSWDPVAYNPLINVYRRMAKSVRTIDEHPLTLNDIQMITSSFPRAETRFFWLTTLLVFIFMFIWQRRDPNRVRYWKAVVQEGPEWEWLYRPLERVDRFLLSVFPFLNYLCWNVVIIGRNDKGENRTNV